MPVPPAPVLPGDAYLEVFIHPAGPYQATALDPANKFSDARRLEQLGHKMIEMAYMHVMFARFPRAQGDALATLVNTTINGYMQRAVETYRWKEQVRGCPPHIDLMQSAEESYRIFRTYAGAVHVAHGFDVLKAWLDALTTI